MNSTLWERCRTMGFHPPKARLPGQLPALTMSASRGALHLGSTLQFIARKQMILQMKLSGGISGGRGGIRTHGGLAPTAVFKTAALNHSATLPAQVQCRPAGGFARGAKPFLPLFPAEITGIASSKPRSFRPPSKRGHKVTPGRKNGEALSVRLTVAAVPTLLCLLKGRDGPFRRSS
ncbi:hypothetical protein BOSEA31B_10015 [Hyphomicrobiales bacterium]|nr:hypothetical protein BOSEA31B_10015 [Hyphomicrobiales bacterium]CAH1701694.1 hypothetical protein BOSEA1005_21393 [Hyphomicrobiales bacterium]CAI0345851.1 hypothetical protein BO1005MUT1_470009 [Hyphomicrobiales bacterium]